MRTARGFSGTSVHTLKLSTTWRWVANFTIRLLFIFRKNFGCPLDRRPGGTQSHSRLFRGTIRRSFSPQPTQCAQCTIPALCCLYHTPVVNRTEVPFWMWHWGKHSFWFCQRLNSNVQYDVTLLPEITIWKSEWQTKLFNNYVTK
jgi:hypothetical protein